MTGDKLMGFVNNTLFPTLKNLPVDATTPLKKAIVQTTFSDANNYMKDGVLLRQVNSLLRDVLDYTADDRVDVILMNPPYGGSEKADVKNHFPDDLASSETADLFMAVIMFRLKKNGRAAVILPDGFLFGTDNAKINLKKKLLSEFNLHNAGHTKAHNK